MTLKSVNPRNLQQVGELIHHTSAEAIKLIVSKAAAVCADFDASTLNQRVQLLELLSQKLEQKRPEICQICVQETPYPQGRIETELNRVAFTIQQYVALLRTESIGRRTSTAVDGCRFPAKGSVIESHLMAKGVVVDLESSNFPIAFGVIGNNVIAALSCGCPLIAKVHELHPHTATLLGSLVQESLREAGLPEACYSLVYGGPEQVAQLLALDHIAVVTFTGSRKAGDAIEQILMRRRAGRAEFYGEYGSINPQVILRHALADSSQSIALAQTLFDSNQLAGGQFCTNPGLLIIGAEAALATEFTAHLSSLFKAAANHCMLGRSIVNRYNQRVLEVQAEPGVRLLARGSQPLNPNSLEVFPVLFQAERPAVVETANLKEEIFGPALVIAQCPENRIPDLLEKLGGQLVTTIFCTEDDRTMAELVRRAALRQSGRVAFNEVPTGVVVCADMQHAGPYPAASRDVSSVGLQAEVWGRFLVRRTQQNLPSWLL